VRKRPQPKVAAAKQKADAAEPKSKPAASRSRSAVLLRTVQTQQAAHELLDQLGLAQHQQQIRQLMTADELQQVQRLTKLLNQLRTASVVNQRISRVLTQQQYQQYQAAVDQPYSSAQLLRGEHMPSQLVTYKNMIQQADKLNALAEAAYKRRLRSGNVKSSQKLGTQAEKLYEDACCWLDGVLAQADSLTEMSMRAWLDREFDYSPDGKISIDCVGVARIYDSASHYCLTDPRDQKDQRKNHQHREQTEAVISALQQLLYESVQENKQEHSSGISKRQQLLNSSSDEY